MTNEEANDLIEEYIKIKTLKSIGNVIYIIKLKEDGRTKRNMG